MNSIYRSIWNDSTGTFVAVPENARSAGKKTSSGSFAKGASSCFALKALAVSVMLAFGASNYAAPTGGAVTAGSASITNGPGSTVITQASQNVAINWQSFNIGTGEAVRFEQLNNNSVALNRVLGSDPSSILGSLSANGKVFLLNPNGILFGKGASVNVGGLVASTLNIADSDFMAGNYKFAGAGNGTVVNQGSINADGGYVALLGANVGNEGVILAKLGSVALAAGNAMTLDVAGDGLLNVTVNQGAVNALVQNGGLIQADGGQVLLTAQAAGSLLQSAVNNTGVIQAQTIQNHNGTIRLMGDMQSGTVSVAGTLDASGTSAGKTGGNVLVTGHHVGLFDRAKIDASGDVGGGTILIGGDFQGKNPAVQNAQATYVSPDASVKADAITSGDGGKVIVWADDFTRFQGNISARGGAQSGNGGLVETSGHINLEVLGGSVDTSAPLGKAGTWLLDPYSNVNITTGATTGTFDGLSPTNTFTPTQDTAIVNADTISAALASGSVNIMTTNATGTQAGTITVSAHVTRSAGTGTTTLTLTPNQATGGTITVASGGDISGSSGHPLNVSLAAKGVGATVAVGAPITTFGGNFTSTGTTFTNAAGPITTAGGKIDINQTETVTIANPLISSGGNIVIAGGSTFTDTSTIDAGTGTVTLQGSADTVAIGVGSTTGTFNITQAEIAGITTTGGLIIGRSTGTAAITIGTLEVVDFGTKNVTIQQGVGGLGMTVNGAIVSGSIIGSGSMNFIAGDGFFINNQVINTTGAVNITADQVTINANIAGTGKLTIAPFSAATAIQVGVAPTRIDFGTSSFITDSISSQARTFQVGDTTNTGGITVTGAFNPGFSTLNLVTGGALNIPVAANTITAPNVVLAGSSFNNAGSATIATPGGRWLVYSTNPISDVKGGLAYNFKQYNLAYPGTPDPAATGNGFIYSVAPMITPSLITGVTAVSKTYNGTAAASLASDNYATSGALDGDTVLLNNPTSGLYNDKNVGTGKSVTASGLSIASATNGTATVYGYQLADTSASGN
ncbi:MAG TPA: filamentous hemagglutinin N-terminal domain-containing protein, partial [Rhodoferax sp.]